MKTLTPFFTASGIIALLFSINTLQAQASIKIGKQTWAAKNLAVTTFRNGDTIPEAKTDEEWKKAGENKTAAWCYYDNHPMIGTIYGKLYNWYAVNDKRGLAPKGWHIPSEAEWKILTDTLGGEHVAGNKMKNTIAWEFAGETGNGDNSSGFAGMPGGIRFSSDGRFGDIGHMGYWWSSDSLESRELTKSMILYNVRDFVIMPWMPRQDGMSVRCLKD